MSRKGRLLAVFAMALLATFAGSGCGQKGPLFLPGTSGHTSGHTSGVVGAAAGSASSASR